MNGYAPSMLSVGKGTPAHPACRMALVVFLVSLTAPPSIGAAQEPSYAGKTITVVIGTSPGGSQDVRTKVVMRYLQKHIPGHPHIVPQYMPGGGGMKSANYLFAQATRDGLTVGSPGSTIVDNAILGVAGARYDLAKFIYLGVPTTRQTTLFMTRKQLGLTSLERLRDYPGLKIPGQAIGHAVYIWARLFAWLLDLKQPRFVLGYSTPERDLAFQQGEADVTVRTADVIEANFPDYLKKNQVDFHATLDFPAGARHPVFGFLPDLDRFAKNQKELKLLELTRAARIGGTPFVLPPGTPTEATEIMRQAMRKAFSDPGFQKEFREMTGEEASPLLPDDHEKAIRAIPREGDIVELYRKVAGVDPLPAR